MSYAIRRIIEILSTIIDKFIVLSFQEIIFAFYISHRNYIIYYCIYIISFFIFFVKA